MRQAGLFGLSDQLKRLSDCGDPLETMGRVVDFEIAGAWPTATVQRVDGRPTIRLRCSKLILAAQNTVSDARMEFLIRDRLSWLRFLGFDLGAVTPDENTIRLFREKLTRAGALDALFTAFDRCLRDRMGGQIGCDAGGRPQAAQHRGREGGDQGGPSAAEIGRRTRRKRRRRILARWKVRQSQATARRQADIAIPSFG